MLCAWESECHLLSFCSRENREREKDKDKDIERKRCTKKHSTWYNIVIGKRWFARNKLAHLHWFKAIRFATNWTAVFSRSARGQWVAVGWFVWLVWLVSSRCIHLHGQRLGVALRELGFWGMDMEVQALRDLPLALLPSGPAALVAAWDIIDPSKESTSWTRSSTGEPSEVLSIPRYDISAIEILDPGILNGLYWLTANPNECFVLICFDFSPMFTDLCVVKILSVCVFFIFVLFFM